MNAAELNLSKAAYSIRETLAVVPFGRTTLFHLIKQGELPARKRGKNTLILAADLAAYLSSLETIERRGPLMPEAHARGSRSGNQHLRPRQGAD